MSYNEVIGRNISAARGRLRLSQAAVAARMKTLGFTWSQQTVASIEKTGRRATAEEIHGLAWALETTIATLMSPSDQDDDIELPGGQAVGVVSVQRLAGRGVNDHAVRWAGTNSPTVMVLRQVPGTDVFERGEFLEQLYPSGVARDSQVSAQQSPEAEEAP